MYVVTVHGSNHQKHISHKVKSQQQGTNVKHGELMTTTSPLVAVLVVLLYSAFVLK
jgi:hypothetical protein